MRKKLLVHVGLMLAVAVCTPTLVAVGQTTLGAPVNYAVGVTPGAVVTGDFNHDGKLDLAVANIGSNDISILIGNGDGTFQPPVNYSVGLDPVCLVMVDLNGDHYQDLAIAFHGDAQSHQPGGVSLLVGNGDGTFKAVPGFASSDYPEAIVAGDLDGDGKADLGVANIDASISVFLGNGDGTFRSAGNYRVTGDPESILIGDFNKDGKQDLLVTTNYSPVVDELAGKASVLLGNGNGIFQAATETDLGGAAWSGVVGDFNGDDNLDLAFITKSNVFSSPSIAVALGQGNGQFATSRVIDANFDTFLAVDDINEDGNADLIALHYPFSPTLRLFLGHGDGTFQLAQTVALQNFGPAAVAIGDFNGDQLHDLAVTMSPQNVVSILINTTTDFSISASPLAPGKVSPGRSSTSTITSVGANGFSGSISLTCSVQPTPPLAPQCAISPNSVSPGTPAALTITTSGPSAALNFSGHRLQMFVLWLPLCAVLFLIPQTTLNRDRRGAVRLILLCLSLTLAVQIGCGGGGNRGDLGGRTSGTPSGNYTIVIKGNSGSMQHTTSLALLVQ